MSTTDLAPAPLHYLDKALNSLRDTGSDAHQTERIPDCRHD